MRWLSQTGTQKKREAERDSLLNVPRPAFAWLPTVVQDEVLWLEPYSKVYRLQRCWFFGIPGTGIFEAKEKIEKSPTSAIQAQAGDTTQGGAA